MFKIGFWAIRSVQKVENNSTQLSGLKFSPNVSYGEHSYAGVFVFSTQELRIPIEIPTGISIFENPSLTMHMHMHAYAYACIRIHMHTYAYICIWGISR